VDETEADFMRSRMRPKPTADMSAVRKETATRNHFDLIVNT